MLRIQVKAKREREWPAVRGVYRPDDFLVSVDFQKKESADRPDFYILELDDWVKLVREERSRLPDITVDDRHQVTYPAGWKGMNIRPTMIAHCRASWEKITDRMT